MIAVLTADIVNSTANPDWLKHVTPQLQKSGKTPEDWQIYRGDSIQLRLEKPEESLETALLLKSAIKQYAKTDIRISIGIGTEDSKTKTVSMNTGTAYEFSGRLLEENYGNLRIQTPWEDMNDGLNAGIILVNALCEQWTATNAQYFNYKLSNPDLNQSEIAQNLKTTQPNVSRVLSRAHWNEISNYLNYFSKIIKDKL